MKKLTYRILIYVTLGFSLLGLVLLIVSSYFHGGIDGWAATGIAIFLLGLLSMVLVQCLYRATKDPLPGGEGKECEACHTMNDKDAAFCKKCGKKF